MNGSSKHTREREIQGVFDSAFGGHSPIRQQRDCCGENSSRTVYTVYTCKQYIQTVYTLMVLMVNSWFRGVPSIVLHFEEGVAGNFLIQFHMACE